jgi:hypothetical protein
MIAINLYKNYLSYILLTSVMIDRYILNLDYSGHLRLIYYSTISLALLLYLVTYGYLEKKAFYLFSVLISLALLSNIGLKALITSFFLIIMYFISREKLKINYFFYAFLAFISIFITFVYLEPYPASPDRYITNIPDPNFTGLTVLLLFFMFEKLKLYMISIPIVLLGVIYTDSRNFLLAIIVYYLIKLIKNFRVINFLLNKLNFQKLFLIFFLISVIVSLVFIWQYREGLNVEFFNLTDSSNKHRFMANIFVLNEIFINHNLIISGEKNYMNYMLSGTNNIVHNSILELFPQYGVLYTIIYIFILSLVLNKFYLYENYEYIVSYFVFATFLMACFTNHFMILFFFVLAMKNVKFKYKNTKEKYE